MGASTNVIPAKAGIQKLLKLLGSGFRRNDEYGVFRDALMSILSLNHQENRAAV